MYTTRAIHNAIFHQWLLFLIAGKVLIAANWIELSYECLVFLKLWTHLSAKEVESFFPIFVL